MAKSFFKEGSKVTFNGIKGVIVDITETYRKNVLVVQVDEIDKSNQLHGQYITKIGLFEYPDGRLEFMNIIE